MTFLIYFGIFDLNSRYIFLVLLVLGILASVFLYNLDLTYLGFNKITKSSLIIYTAVTTLGLLVINISGLRNRILNSYTNNPEMLSNIYFYSLASSPAQEFVFRSYPLAMLGYFGINSAWVYIVFSAFCFSLAHIFLKNVYITVFTFIMGMVWAWIFFYFPDLLLVSISHTVLGVALLTRDLPKPILGSRIQRHGY